LLDQIAESRIRESIDRGDLDDLPGAGRPLQLEDAEPYIDAGMRTVFRILKNAGYLPPEVEQLKGLQQQIDQVTAMTQSPERVRSIARILAKAQQLSVAAANGDNQVAGAWLKMLQASLYRET